MMKVRPQLSILKIYVITVFITKMEEGQNIQDRYEYVIGESLEPRPQRKLEHWLSASALVAAGLNQEG